MQPEEVMLALYSLLQRLEHLSNFNSFFCLRLFRFPLWLMCWEPLSSACWVLSRLLKLPHFQDFSCVSEPLDSGASLSDFLDPEVPLLHWKGGTPCLRCPAACWPGALLGCGVGAAGQGRQDPCPSAQPTEHQCGCRSGWSHSLSLKVDRCWRLNIYIQVSGRDFQAWVSATSSQMTDATTHCFPVWGEFVSDLALRSLFLRWTPSLSSLPAPIILVPSLALQALERKIWRNTLLSLSSCLVSVAPSFSHWLLWTIDLAKRSRTIHCGYCELF